MQYPSYARVVAVSRRNITADITLRDWLEIDIHPQGTGTILYILMNPSKADEVFCDDTVKKLLDFTRQQTNMRNSPIPNVQKVMIVNLFPFYKTESSKLYKVLQELQGNPQEYEFLLKHNMQQIHTAIQQADYIVFGWGDPPKNVDEWFHRNITSEILHHVRLLEKKDTFVFTCTRPETLTKKKHPRHPIIIKLTGLERCEVQPIYVVNPI
ncbi:MAG: DUF1643 domain-containing protein [Ectobacillus sp.]